MLPLHSYGKSMAQMPTTSAQPYVLDRKVKKPLMEKYRRKRINDSLDSLKEFVLMFDQNQRNGLKRQLEKADILERTVECLKKIGHVKGFTNDVPMSSERGRGDSFNEGFNAATRAIFEYLTMTLPPYSSNTLAQQQFQMGLIAHLRMTMQQNRPPVWMPASPKSENSSPSPDAAGSPPPRKRPWQPWN